MESHVLLVQFRVDLLVRPEVVAEQVMFMLSIRRRGGPESLKLVSDRFRDVVSMVHAARVYMQVMHGKIRMYVVCI
jgi:hypothetical protein